MSKHKGCAFHRIISQGDAEDRAAILALVNSPEPHIAVARKLTGAGIYMTEHVVRRHRRNDCTCSMVTL